jgi:uncharacterized protein
MTMNPQENVRIAQQAYENFKQGNIQGIVDAVSDKIVWTLPEIQGVPVSGTRRGRNGVTEFFSTLHKTQEVVSFEPRQFVAQGDTVVALGRYSFRVKASRQQFDSDWAHVFTIENGKIVRFQEFTDTAAVAGAYAKAVAA